MSLSLHPSVISVCGSVGDDTYKTKSPCVAICGCPMAWALRVPSARVRIGQPVFSVCGWESACEFVLLWVMASPPPSLSPWMGLRSLSVRESLSCCAEVNAPSHPPPTASGVGASRLALKSQPAPGLSGNSVLPVGGRAGGWRGRDRGLLSTWASNSPVELGLDPMSTPPDFLQETQTCLSHARMESTDRPLFKRDRQTDSGAPPLGCGQAPPNA